MAKKTLKRLADSGVKSIDANTGFLNAMFSELFTNRNSNSIAVLGTSIEGQTIDASTGDRFSHGAINIANSILGSPFSIVADFGVSGDTSGPNGGNAGMTSRVQSIIDGGYGYCVVGFPINDVNQKLDVTAFTIPNMESIYDDLTASGIIVIALNGAPVSGMSTDAGKLTRYMAVQNAIANYCNTNRSCIYVDTASAMSSSSGVPITSPAVTIDGTHDNYEGAYRKGIVISRALDKVIIPIKSLGKSIISHDQYCLNPYMIGDNAAAAGGYTAGSGVTGTGPNATGATVRATGAVVGSRGAARSDVIAQPRQASRWAMTATTTFDGFELRFGGSELGATGRYDRTWAANTAYTYGERRTPTVANGYHYTIVTPGTTGSTQPTWPTTEGEYVTDGTVVWQCQKTPASGDIFRGIVEFEVPEYSGALLCRLYIQTIDTTATQRDVIAGLRIDLSGSLGSPSTAFPSKMTIETPALTLTGGYSLRYLNLVFGVYGAAGTTAIIDICRASIVRVV